MWRHAGFLGCLVAGWEDARGLGPLPGFQWGAKCQSLDGKVQVVGDEGCKAIANGSWSNWQKERSTVTGRREGSGEEGRERERGLTGLGVGWLGWVFLLLLWVGAACSPLFCLVVLFGLSFFE